MGGFGIFLIVIGVLFIVSVLMGWEAIYGLWELAIIEGILGEAAAQIVSLTIGVLLIVLGVSFLMG